MHKEHRYDANSRAVPIALHADGVTCVGLGKKASKHADCISWCSLLTHSTATASINFIVLFIFQIMIVKNNIVDTMDVVWKNIVWSLYWLYQGVHPDRDADGRMYVPGDGLRYTLRLTALADGFFATMWGARADIEYKVPVLSVDS